MSDDTVYEGDEKLWDDAIETGDVSGLTAEEVDALIHTLTARRLIEALRSPDLGRTPGILSNARGFLRDNDVTGLDIPGSAQAELRKELEARAPFKPKLTGTD